MRQDGTRHRRIAFLLVAAGVLPLVPCAGQDPAATAEPGGPAAVEADDDRLPADTEPVDPASRAEAAAEGRPVQTEGSGRSPVLAHLLESPRLLDDPWGARRYLEDQGLSLNLYLNYLYGANTRGGRDTGDAQRHSLSVDYFVRLDFEKMGLVPGGESLMQVKSNLGQNINPDVGALSDPLDDADFDEALYIDQLYYQQSFSERLVQLRVGYLDQQTILDRNAYANSEDTQFLSTYLDNNNAILPLKIGLGATVWVNPTEWLELLVGTADADNEILLAGFDTAFDDLDSLMAYFEGAFRLKLASPRGPLPGTYRIGTFFDPRPRAVFGRVDPITGLPREDDGHLGAYLSCDQLVYRERPSDLQGLGLFLRWGYKDERVNRVAHFWSTGLQYQGLIPGRDSDALGVALYHAIASGRYRDRVNPDFRGELGVELYYRIQLTPWLAITPDLQYIRNPGGLEDARDSVVLALRGRITF